MIGARGLIRVRQFLGATLLLTLMASASPASAGAPFAGNDGETHDVPHGRSGGHPDEPPVQQPSGPLRVATTTSTNVVVVVVDDLAEMGDTMWDRLPALRSLFVDHGVRFEHAFGDTPLCCPGRATLLTGLYTHHHGVTINDARLFQPQETLATALQRQGYWTMIEGKYFNGVAKLADKMPPGWDRAAIMSGAYYRYSLWVQGLREKHYRNVSDYSGDIITNRALQDVHDVPAGQPFFLYLSLYGVHAGAPRLVSQPDDHLSPVPADRFVGDPRCADAGRWATPATNEADVSDKPAYIAALPDLAYADGGWPLVQSCETLLSTDQAVARLKTELTRQHRLADTLFVLVGDNGMGFGAHRWAKKNVPYATPIPFYVHWKQGLGVAPRTVSTWVSMIDIAPTIVDITGGYLGPYPTGQAGPDGISLWGVLRGAQPGRQMLLEEHPASAPLGMPPWSGLRTTDQSPLGLFTYREYDDGSRELYDLAADPYELQNVAGDPAYAHLQATLASDLADLMSAPAPAWHWDVSPVRVRR